MTSTQHIKTAHWACDVAQRVLANFEDAFPNDERPRKAIEAGRMWARGELKMSEVRQAAFAAHDAARCARDASQPKAEAAARSAGHAAATAHVITHAPHACKYALKACDDPISEGIWQKSGAPYANANRCVT
ncbi:putative immunity protein [Hoeflea marina]|uniref:putative immunity protein n=1 Tax=Hoeflea marina TaxID=274592 RepID=UPI0011B6ED43|nr:hypothetical protein [Hoeflea marina]